MSVPLIKLVKFLFCILPRCVTFGDYIVEVGNIILLKEMDDQHDMANRFSTSSCFFETLKLSLNFLVLPVQYLSFLYHLSPCSICFLHSCDFPSLCLSLSLSLSVPCDEFVSLMPTVSAIINHMELHLLHTHTQTRTHSGSRQSSV